MKALLTQLQASPVKLRKVNKESPAYLNLKASIRKEGVILPIPVRPLFGGDGRTPLTTDDGNPKFEIIDGLHRFTASEELGISDIPVEVVNADDKRVMKLQFMANVQRVVTRPAELAAHLNRIIGEDPTITLQEIADELGYTTTDPVSKLLSINEIKSDEVKKLINAGTICVSNAAELAKLGADDQEKYQKDACDMHSDEFGNLVKGVLKAARDAKRAARDPNAVTGFVYEAHLRPKAEVQGEVSGNFGNVRAQAKAAGVSFDDATAKFLFSWILKLDQPSIDAARAKFEARKAERDAENAKRKAERDARAAAESAAKVASVK